MTLFLALSALYCIYTYLFIFGFILDSYEHLDEWKRIDFIILAIAPLAYPVIKGIVFNKESDKIYHDSKE